MAQISVQAVLPYASGLPEDVAVNTWAFDSGAGGTGPAIVDVIGEALFNFYQGISPYLSPVLSGVVGFKMYDIADPEPRAPFASGSSSAGMALPSTGLPEEVALCLSFAGDAISGTSQARRRGRVYIGPLSGAVVSIDGADRARPTTALIEEIGEQYLALRTTLLTGPVVHSVWSRADADLVPVTTAWIDDAFDTQRRRGVAPTSRTVVLPVP